MLICEMLVFINEMRALLGELLDCLPDSSKWEHDETWKWCWDELSDKAQGKVAAVRRKAVALLLRIEEIDKREIESR